MIAPLFWQTICAVIQAYDALYLSEPNIFYCFTHFAYSAGASTCAVYFVLALLNKDAL
jgi:hypothetical protein